MNPQPRRPLPLRPDLRGLEPYGAPQLHVPVVLNVNENPYAPSESVVADVAEAVRAAARGLNRYPDRDFLDLRTDLAAYLRRESGVALAPEQSQPSFIDVENGRCLFRRDQRCLIQKLAGIRPLPESDVHLRKHY